MAGDRRGDPYMTIARRASISAPAKINLGLEILGRRDDGYHEIRSILAMVELADDLEFTRSEHPGARATGMSDIPAADNLIVRAAESFASAIHSDVGYDIAVTKHIPSPAGLGGASSDAAATLLALNAMHGEPLGQDALMEVASSLGSDVPFFLGSPCAKVSGRGTDLQPLPSLSGSVLIATPIVSVTAKTATLYRMLGPGDMTNGACVEVLSRDIAAGKEIDAGLLANAFARPLQALVPEVALIAEEMRLAGCESVALSGAGPAHYALFADEDSAVSAAKHLQRIVGGDVAVHLTRFRRQPLRAEIEPDGNNPGVPNAIRRPVDATRARP
jgi:4-diphosphocytidyl-2-C-methyl-D-erythritol kinase